ncbi:ABC transporter ATP-binding protein [Salisediminibacterium selenitireducens]|uniref:Oligopeptide/dipeptide ABC transporter, ATPase subunit n=1 Tax=Bacillus selenitireducens (strain ATCC 700615 / DSM 15326 / MLS10) TaxID=439292 RepID=D6XV09_BACIE|nr:ABC transporter ATP-binding protein [Salisediminibacterium selenitireducens]ADH97567.1 oligopeptide/dipeptide ABC transporter, ATPase subunit [[Bacillus] selenitireducens MLS10]
MSNQDALLEIKDLHTGFTIDGKMHYAVKDVSFSVKPREVVCVVGESGCGKSVMSLSVMKLLPKHNGTIDKGQILYKGRDLVPLNDKEMNKIRGKDISMIFQEPMTALNPVMTIGWQMDEVLHNHTDNSREEIRKKSISLLKQVGISRGEQIVNEYPHQLSGGMRQRVMIAMAIACQPQLLIADEPTTALDVTVQAQILELITKIQDEVGMAVMLITHDLGVVAEMADRVVVMYAGQVVEESDVDRIFYDPKHPYTKALLSSIPRMDEDREVLNTIKGIVPSLKNMPEKGCRFVNRCPEAMPECSEIDPELGETEKGHSVRCILYDASKPGASTEVQQ